MCELVNTITNFNGWDSLKKAIQNTTFFMSGNDVEEVINTLKNCKSNEQFWESLLDEIHMDGYAEGHDDGKWGMCV